MISIIKDEFSSTMPKFRIYKSYYQPLVPQVEDLSEEFLSGSEKEILFCCVVIGVVIIVAILAIVL